MTKTLEIHAVSDLHGNMPSLPGGDILIIAGDLTARDTEKDWSDFEMWLFSQKYEEKIFIGGNHDNFLQSMPSHNMGRYWRKIPYVTYLCDSEYEVAFYPNLSVIEEGQTFYRPKLKIWGSPWQPSFIGQNPKCAAFSLDTEDELAEKFKLIPDDVDILITHGPPYGILDKCQMQNVGSKALTDKVTTIRPMLHIFGHIHDCGMQSINDFDEYENKDSHFLNCAFVDEDYEPRNQFFRICLESVNNKWDVKMISRRKV